MRAVFYGCPAPPVRCRPGPSPGLPAAASATSPPAAATTAAATTAAAATLRPPDVSRAEVAELVFRLTLPVLLEGHSFLRSARPPAAFPVGRSVPIAPPSSASRRARLAVALLPLARSAIGAWWPTRVVTLTNEGQRQLALVVDVGNAHFDLITQIQHVFDAVDAPVASQLGDMQQPVPAGKDVHERPELGDVHDLARVHGADLRHRGIEDQVDAPASFLDLRAVLRADRHRADDTV